MIANPIISQVTGALLQVLIVFVIAAMVWLIFGRKREHFLFYVGLRSTTSTSIKAAIAVGVVLPAIMLAIPSTRALVIAPNTIVSEIVAELGRDRAIFILLITAILKTAFAEELLFRGLIGKRLINWLGFGLGNGIQAALFGSVHLLLFSSAQWQDQRSAVILSLLAVTILGWVNGWLNERLGKGSIIPGWIVHGLSNAISYLTAAFFLL